MTTTLTETTIKNKIHTIRGLQIMLDSDLAVLYGVGTKQLNRAVKRNKERFPKEFMFQLDKREQDILLQNTTPLRFKNGTSNRGGRRYLPYAFTEQGVSMLSGVLRSTTAIKVSIQIMNAFISMRRFISENIDVFSRLNKIEFKQLGYDKDFEKVFKALETHKPTKGIFYDGQVFDAYTFIAKIIRSANESIVLIDNYVDETTLTLFSKSKVELTIYTEFNKTTKTRFRKI